MGGEEHYNTLYPARPENIYLLKMLGGILGREKRWKSFPLFNHFPSSGGKYTSRHVRDSLGKTKLHPAARGFRGTNL